MKKPPSRTQFRSFRLPLVIDRALWARAKELETSQAAVLTSVLADAIRCGKLPKPTFETDTRQLDLL